MSKNLIEDLHNKIADMDHAYYNTDTPLCPDDVYDEIREAYDVLITNNKIGSAPLRNKYTHLIPLASLDKVNSVDDFIKFQKRKPNIEYFVTTKLDGLAIVLYYEHGQFVRAVTRGDGVIGQDVTHILTNVNFPKTIGTSESEDYDDFNDQNFAGDLTQIRGEVLITKNNFKLLTEKLISEGHNAPRTIRNTASGIVNGKHAINTNYLSFYAYDVLSENDNLYSRARNQKLLKAEGFEIPIEYGIVVDSDDAETIVDLASVVRETLPYEIDGIVFREDDITFDDYNGKNPKNAVAWKFGNREVKTKLIDITWQLGRTGRMTPLGHFDPVNIDGATITKASLSNWSFIENMKLKIGSSIKVTRANDVIPKITACIESGAGENIIKPVACPECDSQLVLVKDQLFCQNNLCSGKMLQWIIHVCKVLDIEHLSKGRIKKLYDYKYLTEPADIFNLKRHANIELLDGFGSKIFHNMVTSIDEKSKTTNAKFLQSLNITGLGETISKKMAMDYPNFDLVNILINVIDNINLLSYPANVKNSIMDVRNNDAFIDYITSYSSHLTVSSELNNTNNLLQNKKVLVSGGFDIGSRSVIHGIIENNGGLPTKSLSKNTDIFVMGNKAKDSQPSKKKWEKAMNLNVKCYTEDNFLALITD